MTDITKKLTTAIATGALLAQSAAPIAFAGNTGTTIEISGNGAMSTNNANVNQTSNTTVNQKNTATVTNTVSADADSGDNDANYNTGGMVTVDTGKATTVTNISNDLNTNVADVENCNCAQDTDVLISGNGAHSDNDVVLRNTNNVELNQRNTADVVNTVEAEAETGENSAGYNTGGDVVVITGDATTDVSVSTSANRNVASIGGSGNGASASFRIIGNGAGSDNLISARLLNETDLNQANRADVVNYVEAEAETGENDANYNTGDGWVIIDTGDATTTATIDNNVNFNAADVDCGCVYDVLAKIAGNGADAGEGQSSEVDNKINAYLNHMQDLGQTNAANLDNVLDELEAETGENEAGQNTAGTDTDPAIFTGDASTTSGVSNSGNENVLGNVSIPDLPDFDFDWDWAAMFAYFSM